MKNFLTFTISLVAAATFFACNNDDNKNTGPNGFDSAQVNEGKNTFRFETYGNETFWTETMGFHEIISTKVDPKTAMAMGLKVDADALPQEVKTALKMAPLT
jgi:hypothetical protein